MKKYFAVALALLVAMPLLFSLAGCGSSSSGGGGGASILGIDLEYPDTLSGAVMANGTTAKFEAIGYLTTGKTKNITNSASWTSLVPAVATVSKGVVTAVANGDTVISVTYGGETESVEFTVEEISDIVVLPPDTEFSLGETPQTVPLYALALLTPSGETQYVTDQVTWDSSNEAAATVSAAGVLTPVAAPDSTDVTAMFNSGAGAVTSPASTYDIYEPASIVVLPAAPQTGLVNTVVAFDVESGIGDTLTSNPNISWSAGAGIVIDAATGIATLNAVSPSISNAGGVSFTAATNSITDDNGDGIWTALGLIPGDRIHIVTTSGTNDDIYEVDSLDADVINTIEPLSDEAAGADVFVTKATGVTATWTENDGITTTTGTEYYIAVAEPEQITITGAPGDLDVAETDQLGITADFADGTSQSDLEKYAEWSSSDDTSATVTNTPGTAGGLVTGVAEAANIDITASIGASSDVAVIDIVNAPVLTAIDIATMGSECTDADTLPYKGGENQMVATATWDYTGASGCPAAQCPADITDQVTWATSNAGVVQVLNLADTGGNGYIWSIKNGTADISATMGSVVNTAAVTVTSVEITALTNVSPVTDTITITLPDVSNFGSYATVTGVYLEGGGGTCDMQDYVTWTSDDETIAVVSDENGTDGLIIGVLDTGNEIANIGASFYTLDAAEGEADVATP